MVNLNQPIRITTTRVLLVAGVGMLMLLHKQAQHHASLPSHPHGSHAKRAGGRGDPVSHTVRFEDEFGQIEWIAEFLAFGDNVIEAMRGWQVTDIYGNEADTLPVEVLTTGIGRIDRYPARSHFAGYPPERRSWGQMCFDLNAPDEDNWTYRVFHDDQERERIARQLSEGLEEGAKPIRINFHPTTDCKEH